MANEDENILHLGADLDKNFVLKFRECCRLNDFKQKTIIRKLAEFWLSQDPIIQEHIYRGRWEMAIELFYQIQAAVEDESAAATASKARKRKQA